MLIGVGFAAARTERVPPSSSGAMSALLLNVTLPATIFSSLIRPIDTGFLRDSAAAVALGTVWFLAMALASLRAGKLAGVPEGRRGLWSFCCTFCNNGFMGFPIVYALFREDGLALAVMLGIPFNVLVYSLGVRMVCLDRGGDREGVPFTWRAALLTMVNLSIVLGLIFYVLQIPVPEVVLTPIQYLADITTPLSMLVIGMNLARGRIADAVRDRDAITAALVRLVVFPAAAWALFSLLPGVDVLVRKVFLITMAMPTAAVATVLSEQYGGDTDLAARAVFLSSLACILSIPLIFLLL